MRLAVLVVGTASVCIGILADVIGVGGQPGFGGKQAAAVTFGLALVVVGTLVPDDRLEAGRQWLMKDAHLLLLIGALSVNSMTLAPVLRHDWNMMLTQVNLSDDEILTRRWGAPYALARTYARVARPESVLAIPRAEPQMGPGKYTFNPVLWRGFARPAAVISLSRDESASIVDLRRVATHVVVLVEDGVIVWPLVSQADYELLEPASEGLNLARLIDP